MTQLPHRLTKHERANLYKAALLTAGCADSATAWSLSKDSPAQSLALQGSTKGGIATETWKRIFGIA
jgi:hypothetical protein